MPVSADEFLGTSENPTFAGAAAGMAAAQNVSSAEEQIKRQSEALGKQLEEQSFLKRNTSLDVPLDSKAGLPAWLRFNIALDPDLKHQKQYLLSRPEVIGLRETDDGSNLIVRLRDDSVPGGMKDYLAHPTEFTGRSLASAAGAILASLPTIAATALVPGSGSAGILKEGAKMAAATIAGGAATDTAVRTAQGTDVDLPEQASRRLPEAALNAAIPMAFSTLNRIQSPFGSYAGPQQRLLAKAVEDLKSATGTDINLTAAQRTGSPFLARYEAFVSKLPGGGQMKAEQAAQDEAIRQTQRSIAEKTGGSETSQADIGARAGKILATEDSAAQASIDRLREQAAQAAQGSIENLVSKLSTPNASLSGSEVGGAIRNRFMQLRQEFEDRAQQSYAEAKAAIGPNDNIVPLKPIQDFAEKLTSSNFEATQKLAPGLKRVISLAEDLGAEAENGNLSLDKVRSLRSLLGSSLAQGEPVGELQTSYAKGLYKTLTDAIEQGVDSLNNPEAKKLLQEANAQYREGIAQLEQTGVAKAFKTDQQAGFLSDAQIPDKVFGDIDQMRRYKNLLGEHSPEYQGILRVGLDNIVAKSKAIGNDFIDAGDFLKNLNAFRKSSPEAFQEVFGNDLPDVLKNANLLKAAQGAKIDGATLDQIIKSDPVKIGPMLQSAIDLEKNRDAFYANKVVRDLLDGTRSPAQLNPDEFVSRFVMNTTPKDAANVMSALSKDPQVVADIRRKTVEQVLQESARPTQASDIVARQVAGNNAVPVDATKLSDLLSAKGTVLKEVLDPNTYQLLEKYLTVEGSRLNSQTMGGQAGSLKNASIMAAFLDGFRGIPELADIAKFKLMAMLLSSKTFQNLISRTTDLNSITPLSVKQLLYSSPEVLHMLTREAQSTPEILQIAAAHADAGTQEKKHSAEDFLGTTPPLAPVSP